MLQAGGRVCRALRAPGARGVPWANEEPEINRLCPNWAVFTSGQPAYTFSGVGVGFGLSCQFNQQQKCAQVAERARDGGTAPKLVRRWVELMCTTANNKNRFLVQRVL